ncbi:hypothetical protein HY386_02790 [Candidatus Daviesbacteria bacterium]|nr:hypothetical protein [Candidatus Daviesbacteria bacterium]
MSQEVETRKFRLGESGGRPLGGNISPDPFPQALSGLARSRGHDSQLALGRALGKKRSATVGAWYRGECVPSPDGLESILRVLKPDDEEKDVLLELHGRVSQERRRGIDLKKMRPAETPLEEWIKQFCQERHLTIGQVTTLLSLHHGAFRIDRVGMQTYSRILQDALARLGLSDQETVDLGDAVARTIQQRIAAGRKLKGGSSISGSQLRNLQQRLACVTYNGQQAGEKLGITREMVRQLRGKFDLPLLLTEKHLEMLRKRRQRV